MTTPAREDVVAVPCPDCLDGVCTMNCSSAVARITAVVREADRVFERVGGSSRHWTRDCFLPLLEKAGLRLAAAPAQPAPEVVGLLEEIRADYANAITQHHVIAASGDHAERMEAVNMVRAIEGKIHRIDLAVSNLSAGISPPQTLEQTGRLISDFTASDAFRGPYLSPSQGEQLIAALRTASPSAPPVPDAGEVVEAARGVDDFRALIDDLLQIYTPVEAARWFALGQPLFEGRLPADVMESDGIAALRQPLRHILEGVYS